MKVEKMRKVAIIGCADSRRYAPVHEPGWEFWGVNNLYLTMPGVAWSRWFELHGFSEGANGVWLRRGSPDFRGRPVNQYLAELDGLGVPVYMQKEIPAVRRSVEYPLRKVLEVKEFANYFTNTISYEIALAIMEGFQTIGIWGVDMAVASPILEQNEYSHQRPSCEYFIGLARGKGIEVIIPDSCDLLKTRFLYAFEEDKEHAFAVKTRELVNSMRARQHEHRAQIRTLEQKLWWAEGAEHGISEMYRNWGPIKGDV